MSEARIRLRKVDHEKLISDHMALKAKHFRTLGFIVYMCSTLGISTDLKDDQVIEECERIRGRLAMVEDMGVDNG